MNILIISPGSIHKPTGGASNRAYNLAAQLKKHGNEIIILEPSEKKAETLAREFETYSYFGKIGKRSLSAFCDVNPFFIFKLVKVLITQPVDIVQTELPWGAPIARLICTIMRKRTKVVYNSQNYQKKVQKDLARYWKNSEDSRLTDIVISTMLAFHTRVIEKLSVTLSDMVLCVSNDDKLSFMNEYSISPHRIEVIPNGANLQKIRRAAGTKKKFGLDESKLAIIFHGSYAYPPNFEAINFIKNSISTEVKKEAPNVEFIVAGADVPKSNESGAVRFLGFVEDIYSLLRSSDIAIAPIVSGGGTKLKILDYLSAGLPIVATKKSIEGIDAENNKHAIIVEGVGKEFISALNYLINNEEGRKRIGANAARLAEERYDWDKIGESLNKLYREILVKSCASA